jgi:transcriptional activator cubitus interruptus
MMLRTATATGTNNPAARGVNGYPPNHPNSGIVLEEVGEGHMVEEKLVVPDEMLQYLNQVRIERLINRLIGSNGFEFCF